MKKFLSILMVCIFAFSVFAMNASAASKAVTKIEVTIGDSGTPTVPAKSGYTIDSIYYYNARGVRGCAFNVNAKNGYTIADDAVVYVNGKSSSGTLLISSDFASTNSVVVLQFSSSASKFLYSSWLTLLPCLILNSTGGYMADSILIILLTSLMKADPGSVHSGWKIASA